MAELSTALKPGFGRKSLPADPVNSAKRASPTQTAPAAQMLENAATAAARANPARQAGFKDLMWAAVWGGGGVAVTIATYQAAVSQGGGHYTVAYGAMAVGAFRAIRGAFRLATG